MASRGDDRGEMTTAADDTAVEEAFEAYLAGRPVADAGAGLASFAAAVRATATQPGRPNAALAELLATGLLVDQSAPSPRTATTRRRRRFAMFFPALLAKLLSAGAVAQAATGAGVAVVVVCSAGAAGVLPGPVQDTFSNIVGTQDTDGTTVQPTETTPAAPTTEVADPTESTPTVAEPTEAESTEAQSEDTEGPDPSKPFGDFVSGQNEHGYINGCRVSDWAHRRNGTDPSACASATQVPESAAPVPTDSSGSDDGAEAGAAAGDDGGHGHGHGHGHGSDR
jgi:hypothetical protein